ncbi:hypothetical protein [Kribbella deserti]|uniref:Uncharacterized protein n=1 Tax=Kribbella deserti TaxID=1926257 RepID=A0ABV6QDV0_9ACTN
MTELALLVEPTSVERDVQSVYKNQVQYRDEVTANVTCFGTSEALETRRPTAVYESIRIVHKMLASSLDNIVGGALVGVVRTTQTKSGEGYVFRDPDDETFGHVAAYHQAREAAAEQAMADAPSFD